MKMYERALAGRGLLPSFEPDTVPLGPIDRSLPLVDRPDHEEANDMSVKQEPVALTCDSCSRGFTGVVLNRDELPEFDPKTAGALCPPCGEEMARLMRNRSSDPESYLTFRNRCAESVARKLGLTPRAN